VEDFEWEDCEGREWREIVGNVVMMHVGIELEVEVGTMCII